MIMDVHVYTSAYSQQQCISVHLLSYLHKYIVIYSPDDNLSNWGEKESYI